MKKILVIGIKSKIGKLFNDIYKNNFHIYGTTSKKTDDLNNNIFHLDLNSVKNIDNFIEKVGNIKFDGVIYLPAIYQIDNIDNIDAMAEQLRINVLNIYHLTNKLNLNINSKNIFFTDGGTKIPKNGYFSYTLSKDILKSLIISLAVKNKEHIYIGFDLGPIITDMAGEEEQKNFYNKSLLQIKSPAKGLVSFIKYILEENNFYSTGSIIDFTGGTYLIRNS
ncbi:MAG: hypothetical protein PHF46_01760 [Candidatus Gracilibacteria bacterium]|nr:hypothetical protein [Candidatus Gracilibacteria bacterium]MDD3120111.1 hypothetical protein [Candidatus Gracilibacteria bacterium]MDD4530588.1 hypothetical protein [Candidatus Gracilibacteria bacterium]